MFKTKINIARCDFDKIEYEDDDESEIIFYITTGGNDLPEIKVKCVIEKTLFVKDNSENYIVGMTFDQFLKDQIEKDFKIKEIKNYSLELEGFITGIENVTDEKSKESDDYIVFNVSDASTVYDDACHHRLV